MTVKVWYAADSYHGFFTLTCLDHNPGIEDSFEVGTMDIDPGLVRMFPNEIMCAKGHPLWES